MIGVTDIKQAIKKLDKAVGYTPNCMFFSRAVLERFIKAKVLPLETQFNVDYGGLMFIEDKLIEWQ